jgi:hypothetical protein
MPECRFGPCTEQATWSAIVRSDAEVNGSRHEVTATYCDKHLQYQKERLGATPGVSLTDIERLPECSCAMTEEGLYHCPVHGLDAPDPDAETGRRLASEREDLIAAGADPADLLIPIHPEDAVPECRQLICDQPAEFEVTVRYFGGVRERKALYCTEHLTAVQEALATRETSEITHIRPLRGTTMTDPNYPGSYPPEAVTEIRRLNDDNQNLESVNVDLKRDVVAADAAIGRLKEANQRLAVDYETVERQRDGLVAALHSYANDVEEGTDSAEVVVERIDNLLKNLSLPARIKHFEIIVTVPAQVRVKVSAKDKDTAREMFDQGKVGWRSEDYEEWLEDDTEVVEIIEVEQ